VPEILHAFVNLPEQIPASITLQFVYGDIIYKT